MKRIFLYASLCLLAAGLSGCKEPDVDTGTSSTADFSGLIISEIAANEEKEDMPTWVEILNTSDKDIDMTGLGLYIFDEYFKGKELASFNGRTLRAGRRLVVSTEDESLITGFSSTADFTLVLGVSATEEVDKFSRSEIEKNHGKYGSYQMLPEIDGKWTVTAQASRRMANMDPKPNAIWMWSSHLDQWIDNDFAVLKKMKQLGYDHVLLNYNAFDDATKVEKTHRLIAKSEEIGMNVHAWIQCFYSGGKWINPIEKLDDKTGRYKQEEFDRIIANAHRYIDDFGVKGIHLDYIRFSGVGANAAYNNNYDNGVTAVGAVTEFCRQLRQAMDTRPEAVILSAACMAENNAVRNYGQSPANMGKYLDVLMPMIYRYHSKGAYGEAWMQNMAKLFTEYTNAQTWAGITTYDYVLGTETVSGLQPAQIRSDAEIFLSTDCTGLVLFRYALGEFPDVNDLWNNK